MLAMAPIPISKLDGRPIERVRVDELVWAKKKNIAYNVFCYLSVWTWAANKRNFILLLYLILITYISGW